MEKQRELYESVFPKHLLDTPKLQGVMTDCASLHLRDDLIRSSAVFNPEPVPRMNIEAFKIPPNPIHKTNEKLDELNERMDSFTDTLAGHLEASAVAIQGIASEIKTGSTGTSKQNWWAIGIAALSLVVAIAGFFKDSFKSPPSDTKKPAAVAPAPDTPTPAAMQHPAPVKPVKPMKSAIPAKRAQNP
ncbi:MAG TPA: hypothetical protein DDX01_03660 [Holosporales bacterium]|nr:hypothetical protein [Holosporales bacterium]